jgi:hypothetical protein
MPRSTPTTIFSSKLRSFFGIDIDKFSIILFSSSISIELPCTI